MRHKERFCGLQVRGNVSQILSRALFLCRGKYSASATPPTRPPHCGPDFLTAELPASKGMPPLFSQPLKGARQPRVHPGNVSPTELRPVKFCFFPQPCRRRDTGPRQLTSRLEVLKPTRGARDFLMSPSQAEHWKAASRGVGQRGS